MKFLISVAVANVAVAASAGPCEPRGLQKATCGVAPTLGWEFAGPTTYVSQFDDVKVPAAGAVQDVVRGANNTWFIGSVNAGVWRTKSLGNEVPHWENVLDGQPVTCSSIAALHVSAHDPNRVYAGCGGSTSSEQGSDWNVVNSGDWSGIMASKDGGDTWHMLDAFPSNYYVTDILEESESVLIVSAQSHLYDREDGGIWRSEDGGKTFSRVDETPTFTLTQLPASVENGGILATHARDARRSVSLSADAGKTFATFGVLPWKEDASPFYTCATTLQDGSIVVAGLTRNPGLPNNTDSQFFVRQGAADGGEPEWKPLNQPTSMDEDSMPKDRMAILGDPELADQMYVAGNAGALAWRVNVTTGKWTKMWDKPDVVDGSIPHGDCRNFAWEAASDRDPRLLLVSDGGIFARETPRAAGGKWVSVNGDYASMELLSAHYDPRNNRYVAGAQDNCAIVTKINSTASDIGAGFVEGDGTVTLVDSSANPSRLFGTTQFLGVGTIDIDPTVDDPLGNVDDDDDCGGLCFAQGNDFVEVPVDKYFPEPSSFPFFVHAYTLNRNDPTLMHFWTNGTGPERPSAFYQFDIPHSVHDTKEIKAPTKVLETPHGAFILDFVSGGYTAGEPDPSLLLGISNTHLYVRSALEGGANGTMVERPLPVSFARPVTLQYDPDTGARILGPVTHGRTVSMAVSPSDSRVIAVTGWPSVSSNAGDEVVFFSSDAGKTWQNVTGDLREASGVTGKVRPGGVEIVDLLKNNETRALLVGTSSGVLTTFVKPAHVDSEQHWARFGTCDEFPIVLTADLDYEPYSNRLVAATFGRGIYVLKNAKEKLLDARDCMMTGQDRAVEESSARFFPRWE